MSKETPTLTPEERATLYTYKTMPETGSTSHYHAYLAGWNDRLEELVDLRLEIAKLQGQILEAQIQNGLDSKYSTKE